ncbi:DUF2501 domain-containing protein [Bordetella genomosp. 9]|uniref:DUF2501 domain-containing protein n=1 Tax=Bordetella genomosp. 9 TaxID=1416803 RepID=A0A1W6YWV1_9BORD|nr:DUF2501 domain-containing protein [Bordetella genomosp. 9]ARP85536.1 hypothetical protein CAL13_04370 [Bordetella genomosp. 9]
MKFRNRVRAALLAGLLTSVSGAPVLAQGLDFKGALDGLGGLGKFNSGAATSANAATPQAGSLGNATGVLQYCINNNYLQQANASSLKDQLMRKLSGTTGQPAQKDSGYLSGVKGLLQTGSGNTVDLSGGGWKEAATRQVCDAILNQAKSFL